MRGGGWAGRPGDAHPASDPEGRVEPAVGPQSDDGGQGVAERRDRARRLADDDDGAVGLDGRGDGVVSADTEVDEGRSVDPEGRVGSSGGVVAGDEHVRAGVGDRCGAAGDDVAGGVVDDGPEAGLGAGQGGHGLALVAEGSIDGSVAVQPGHGQGVGVRAGLGGRAHCADRHDPGLGVDDQLGGRC